MPTLEKSLAAADLAMLRGAIAQLGERKVASLLAVSRGGLRGLMAGKTRSAATIQLIVVPRLAKVRDAVRIAGSGAL